MAKRKRRHKGRTRLRGGRPSRRKPALPDFELGDLQALAVGVVQGKNPTSLEHFFLALAVVFNDLKDIFYFFTQLGKGERKIGSGANPQRGQLNGMKCHLARLAVGLIHELFVLLEKHKEVLGRPEFKQLVGGQAEENQQRWEEITRLAFDKSQDTGLPVGQVSFTSALRRVRHTAAFHYYGAARFSEGFRKFFYEPPETEFNRAAYVSDGRNAAQTRFFYADAAVQSAVELQSMQPEPEWSVEVAELAGNINQVLKPLLIDFLGTRSLQQQDKHEQSSG